MRLPTARACQAGWTATHFFLGLDTNGSRRTVCVDEIRRLAGDALNFRISEVAVSQASHLKSEKCYIDLPLALSHIYMPCHAPPSALGPSATMRSELCLRLRSSLHEMLLPTVSSSNPPINSLYLQARFLVFFLITNSEYITK
jgi:hypothetical protein